MKHTKTLPLILIITLLFTPLASLATTYWDWQNINTQDIQLPASFDWGTTMLAHEVDGYAKTSTWHAWENHSKNNGSSFTTTRSGIGTAHSHNYKQDVQLMKEMGLTTYCFSIDWSKVEPEQGHFDEETLQYYSDLCDELVHNGIAPIVVLKDYCDPLWFGYLGGFEQEKNLYLFERYCMEVYSTLRTKVDRWVTFWAPESYAMLGYLAGTIPPGVSSIHRAANVLKNEFETHVRVYKKIKAAPNGNNTKIGIIKHVHLLEPWHFWDHASCYAANMLTNNSFYTFFTVGTYNLKIPVPGKYGAWVSHTNAYAPKSLDFVGINYYSHGYIKNLVNHVSNPSEVHTDIPGMTVYPEGLYSAIKEVSDNLAAKLNIPMVITQNGVATTDEDIRDLYLKRHLYALSKAVADGYNVQGYCYYSLLDGFSWGSYDKKFGLFTVDRNNLERRKKSGARYYCDVVKKHK